MVTISYTVDAGEVEQYLETKAARIFDGLRNEVQAQTVNLLSYVKDEKLSGQVLHQRSGNLKNSGFTEFDETSGVIEGTVGFGRTVPYAAIHEHGGNINIPEVTGKLMVFERDGKTVFTTRHRAFTVQMPARPYLEPALEEKQPEIVAALEGAVHEAIAE